LIDTKRLESYLRVDPNNVSLLAELADRFIESGDAGAALPYVERALAQFPDDEAFRYRRAVALRRTARAGEAVEVLAQLAESAGVHPAVLHELADIRFEQRDFASCTATLQRLVKTSGYRQAAPRADLLLVRALHHQGRLDESIAHAEVIIARDGAGAELQGALATLYLDAERFDDAARLCEDAVRAGRATPEISCVGGYLALAQEDLARAEQLFSSALQARPDDGRAWLGAGLASAAGGKLEDATRFLQRAIQAMPAHLGTLNALAWVQLLNGALDAADQTLASAMAVDGSFAETHGGQAVVAAMRGDDARARDLARTALKLDKESFSAAYALILLRSRAQPGRDRVHSALELLDQRLATGGGSLKDVVLRMARSSARRR